MPNVCTRYNINTIVICTPVGIVHCCCCCGVPGVRVSYTGICQTRFDIYGATHAVGSVVASVYRYSSSASTAVPLDVSVL